MHANINARLLHVCHYDVGLTVNHKRLQACNYMHDEFVHQLESSLLL